MSATPTGWPADLTASHELLHALLAVSLTGIILFRPVYAAGEGQELVDLAYVQLNPAAQRMLHLPAQPGETFRTLYPNSLETGIFTFYRDTFLTGQPGQYAVNYSYDGLDNFFLLSAQRSGELLLVSFSDTAEQQSMAAQALRKSQGREQAARAQAEARRTEWQRIFERAPIALAQLRGAEFTVEWANARMGQLWGRPLSQIVGHPHFEALPDLAGQGFEAVFAGVLQTGEPRSFNELLVHIEQAQQVYQGYFNLTYQPAYDEQGRITGVLASAVEVTDQVRARQQVQALNEELHASNDEHQQANIALQEAQQQLQQLNQSLEQRVQERTREAGVARAEAERQRAQLTRLFQRAPAAICILSGPELVYELVNADYQQLFPNRPLLGKPLLEALPELRASSTWDTLHRVYRTGQTHVDQSVRIPLARLRKGVLEDVYFDYVFQARTNAHGQSDGVVVFAFDITEQVLTRQQVERLNQELAAINEELTATNAELNASNTQLTRTNVDLDTFVYTASHDLKAPITNIESITLALRDTLPTAVQQDEMIAHLLDLLAQTTTRFQLTIGQLTDLSKLQLAHAGPAEPVNLATVVEAVRLDLAPVLAAANAQCTVEVAPDLLLSFSPANVRSAIYNLLSNAVKYRAFDRPAQVWVRAFPVGPRVVLEVQDNGLGMSEVQQRQLFGLFQRLHTHVEGTGVGLYITKRLVENGGGTIAVQSQVDAGTTFTLTFPA